MVTTTNIIIMVTVLVWLVWDIVLYCRRKKDPRVSTISMIITKFSWYSPALPFAAGFLMGHWFFPA